jgi:hypothetical protein
MAKKRLSKKVAKLEKKADGLRKQAEKKGHELQSKAADRIDDLRDDKKGGRKGFLALLVAAAAAVGLVLKRKRDQELDEALWEEPKSL